MKTVIQPVLAYSEPKVIDAGFSLGQPVLDVHLDGEYAGCLFRSYRNKGRRLEETWQLHLKGGKPQGPKFETLEELILWTQRTLLEETQCNDENS
jgi:hypothetical protein